MHGLSSILPVAQAVADRLGMLPQVTAVAFAGSAASGWGDVRSDIDLDAYITADIPLAARADIANRSGVHVELDNQFWEPGDEWLDAESGAHVDVLYRTPQWIEQQIERVLVRHEASVGYSTCFWYNVLTARNLFDRQGWFADLQTRARQPYPEALRAAIVAKNWPILRHNLSSYQHQIELAFERRDRVSINHRLAALLASYFDILFAINRQPHPGEKRLVQFALRQCPRLPLGLEAGLEAVFRAAAPPGWDWPAFVGPLGVVLDGLDRLLADEGLLP